MRKELISRIENGLGDNLMETYQINGFSHEKHI